MKAIVYLILAPVVLAAIAYGFMVMGATASFFLATIGVHIHWAWCGTISILAILVKTLAEKVGK